MKRQLLATVSAVIAILLFRERVARACPVCGPSEPATYVIGQESPRTARSRVAVVASYAGMRDDDVRAVEARLSVGASVAIARAAQLAVTVPLVLRSSELADRSHTTLLAPGDGDLRVRSGVELGVDGAHVLMLEVGCRFPTHGGVEGLPHLAQVSPSAFEPSLGVVYLGELAAGWVITLGVSGHFPMTGARGWRNGSALRGSVAGQGRLLDWLDVRAVLDARIESASGVDIEGQGVASFMFGGLGAVARLGESASVQGLVRVPLLVSGGVDHPGRADDVSFELGVAIDG